MQSNQQLRPNAFVRNARKLYNPIGFKKGYNFTLFFIFAGALFGFVLARLQFLNVNGVFCNRNAPGGTAALPGECYYYQYGHEKIGLYLHLCGILPAGLLAVWQFLPIIRHKLILVHRINGYLVILLALIGNTGAVMIARNAFGGDFSTQCGVGALVILTTIGLFLSYINIKRLQIDQHRAWMIRTWFYFGSIVTMRLIMIIAAQIVSKQNNHMVQSCAKIDYIYDNSQADVLSLYPACSGFYDGTNPSAVVAAKSNFGSSDVVQLVAAMNMTFGGALWLALWLHAIGVEIYLHLTPKEAARLRTVSYERQLEAGMEHPGDAGITSARLGDAAYYAPITKQIGGEESQMSPVGRHHKEWVGSGPI